MDLRDISLRHKSLLTALGTKCLGKAGLAEGTNAATIKTVNAIDYAINGVLYSKAATDNVALTAAAAQADLTTAYYLICLDTAGAVSSVKGADNGDIPAVPDGKCPIGVIKVVTSGATFTAGTTDLGAAGVTDTYYDLMGVPTLGKDSL